MLALFPFLPDMVVVSPLIESVALVVLLFLRHFRGSTVQSSSMSESPCWPLPSLLSPVSSVACFFLLPVVDFDLVDVFFFEDFASCALEVGLIMRSEPGWSGDILGGRNVFVR